MEDKFVTYSIALMLKEMGYDEECLASFEGNTLGLVANYTKCKNSLDATEVTAPLWQDVIDWFREEYDIVLEINHGLTLDVTPTFYYSIWKMNGASEYQSDCNYTTLKYEEAREQAILKAIEIIKKK